MLRVPYSNLTRLRIMKMHSLYSSLLIHKAWNDPSNKYKVTSIGVTQKSLTRSKYYKMFLVSTEG